MNAEEAYWLKCILQNPIGSESKEDSKMRKIFFDALPQFPELCFDHKE
jgi:hypothetical protein